MRFEGIPFQTDRLDRNGSYSGCALIENDEMQLYYTGNIRLPGDYDYIHDGRESNTCLLYTSPGEGGTEPAETVNGIADYLRSFPTRYYTCHCTGLPAFQMLKDRMGAQISYASAGNLLEI